MKPAFALHETLMLHEIAAFKALCVTKTKALQGAAVDPDLQKLLKADAALSTAQLTELNGLLSQAVQ